MHLDLTDEQKILQNTVREFAEAEVKPHAHELDETGHFPMEIFRKAAELGLTGVAEFFSGSRCASDSSAAADLDVPKPIERSSMLRENTHEKRYEAPSSVVE